MATRHPASLPDPTHRLARCHEHDLPLPARKPLEAHRMARRGRGCRRVCQAGQPPACRSSTPPAVERSAASRRVRLDLQQSSASDRRGRDHLQRSSGPAGAPRLRPVHRALASPRRDRAIRRAGHRGGEARRPGRARVDGEASGSQVVLVRQHGDRWLRAERQANPEPGARWLHSRTRGYVVG